ncbi:hypothetical protein [Kushneria aurantia]|uniref:Cbb3-type cytochrome oxidase assembly protein CcoS n=1 Tax=Kushneria aurantia TaxID=504092 RepID=A0ABV6FZP2_9GAMM|nr:hypothetical protein [Kushneria aurantia]
MLSMLTLIAIATIMLLSVVLLSFRVFDSRPEVSDDEHQLVTLGAARPREPGVEIR